MEEARNECDHEEYGETEEENRPQDGYRRFIEFGEYVDGPQSIAVDSTGSVRASNGLAYNVTQFVGVATPVVTPLAANFTDRYNAPASRP
jgi:hypothetical protein